jgi:dephospho-CoA kinase
MRVIGLTGGIGCGKSTVARLLQARGIPVVSADQLARDVVAVGQPALAAIVRAFGTEYLRDDGTLDRAKLGALVFGDAGARKALEAITHPAIAREAARRIAALASEGHALVFYEIPLLFETARESMFHRTVTVAASTETQIARIVERDGLSRAEAQARIDAQMPVADKVARADHAIWNDGDLDALEREVEALLRELAAS